VIDTPAGFDGGLDQPVQSIVFAYSSNNGAAPDGSHQDHDRDHRRDPRGGAHTGVFRVGDADW
jgi:hypothetical protein